MYVFMHLFIYHVSICVGRLMSWCTFRHQRTIYRSLFSPYTVYILWVELKSLDFGNKHIYP